MSHDQMGQWWRFQNLPTILGRAANSALVVLWHSTLLGQRTNILNLKFFYAYYSSSQIRYATHHQECQGGQEGKPAKKRTTRTAKQAESDTLEENAMSMKSILTMLTAVLSTLTHNQDDQGRPDPCPNVSFTEDGPVHLATSMSQASQGPVFDEMQPPAFPDVANHVHERLTHSLQGTSAPFLLRDDESRSDDKGAAPRCHRRTIKSDKFCTKALRTPMWSIE